MKVRAFITHKCSEYYSDCADRFATNSTHRSVSVSDGISQSIFPADWAELLSSFYANNGRCDDPDRISLCSEWLMKVEDKLAELKSQGKKTRMAERMLGMRKGAGATLCGVHFLNANDWEGEVLGDSCAILVLKRDSHYDLKLLSSEDKEFDNSPDYYDSFPEKSGRGIVKKISGRIDKDNFLLLVTDPFSNFLKDNFYNATQYVNELLELKGHRDFCELVHNWRQRGMHDDDSTLCIIEWDGNDTLQIVHKDDIEKMIKEESAGDLNIQSTIPPVVNIPMVTQTEVTTKEKTEQKTAIKPQTSKEAPHFLHCLVIKIIKWFKKK